MTARSPRQSTGDSVAFIVKSATGYKSPLAHAPFDRQRDVFKLAKMGVADSRRMWSDFASECPGQARVIVADVAKDEKQAAKVTKSVDKRIRKAEKSAKPPKLTKREKQAMRTPVSPAASFDASLSSWLNSDDPSEREAARNALRDRGVFR